MLTSVASRQVYIQNNFIPRWWRVRDFILLSSARNGGTFTASMCTTLLLKPPFLPEAVMFHKVTFSPTELPLIKRDAAQMRDVTGPLLHWDGLDFIPGQGMWKLC
jgi:hypothetical protein